jgi:hypothetical protein
VSHVLLKKCAYHRLQQRLEPPHGADLPPTRNRNPNLPWTTLKVGSAARNRHYCFNLHRISPASTYRHSRTQSRATPTPTRASSVVTRAHATISASR